MARREHDAGNFLIDATATRSRLAYFIFTMKTKPAAFALLLTALTLTTTATRRTGKPRAQPIDMLVIHSTGPECDAKTGQPIWVPAGTLDENMRRSKRIPRSAFTT